MAKFYIHTMGCKSNQFESAIIRENLKKNNFAETNSIEDADYYILNSCTVTGKSDKEAFYLLRSAKHKKNTIKTVLTGCIAQIEKEQLLQSEYIDIVIGNDEKLDFYDALLKAETENFCMTGDIMQLTYFHKAVLENTTKTRASLKIQDGCDNRCSYCIIPYARGKSRSADIEFLIEQINRFSKQGFKEVVFTGIHIGQWGKDIGLQLLDLLKAVEIETKISRYRLGSLNPLEITDDLLNFLKDSEKFCPHFHLSLQSACNKTLKNMNRHYTVEYYLDQIEDIVSRFDKPFLGSDIIAGFVGETDEDFQITTDNLKKSKLSQIHTFPYSIRKGTIAEKMSGHLPDKIKEKRASVIKQISSEKYEDFLRSNIGREEEVLIEKNLDKNGKFRGITRNYITVRLDDGEFNTLKRVQLDSNKINLNNKQL